MRPQLPGSFGHDDVHAPAIASLTKQGTTFARAYCQQAVCSPSRMSFMSGRYPTRTVSWNFINQIREPICKLQDQINCVGNDLAEFVIGNHQGRESACSAACQRYVAANGTACQGWVYNFNQSKCYLKSTLGNCKAQEDTMTGSECRAAEWTPLPLALKQQGWKVYGTSKLWHPDEGGICPDGVNPGPLAPATPEGSPFKFCGGLPPAADPPGWMNDTIQYPTNNFFDGTYEIPPMLGCPDPSDPGFPQGCALDQNQYFCDRNVSDFAVAKLQAYGAARRAQLRAGVHEEDIAPLASFVGFRKPHLAFRFPDTFLKYYDINSDPLPEQRTLDNSTSPWAFHDVQWPGVTPWSPLEANRTRVLRVYYKAAISWMDTQLQRVLTALNDEGLANNTVIVLHADHGWSLGESGEWRKFTEWEQGTRVPLIIIDPSLPASANRVNYDPVELVDVYRTVADLVGLQVPTGDEFAVDGHSLKPALVDPTVPAGDGVALSMYPRCPVDEGVPWKDNWCEFVPRTRFNAMGFSIRVGNSTAGYWRYVEWRRWNGTQQDGDWTPQGLIANGLYEQSPTSQSFDVDKVNVAQQNADVVARLATQLATQYAAIRARPVTEA